MKSIELFKATVSYFERNLLAPKRKGLICINHILEQKNFFGGQHILNHNEISFSVIEHNRYDSQWPKIFA